MHFRSQLLDRWHPSGIAVISGTVLLYWHDSLCRYVRTTTVVEVSINAAFVLVGFVATAQAIIISVANEEFTKRLEKVGGISEVNRHSMESIIWSVAVLVSGGMILAIENPQSRLLWGSLTSIWAATCLAALVSAYRLLDLQQVILQGVNKFRQNT